MKPEILIVDEVLAVGDAEFQKKCLGKIKDVAGHGRTVLFVSHNLSAVAALCSHAVLLDGGELVYGGDVGGALARYRGGGSHSSTSFVGRQIDVSISLESQQLPTGVAIILSFDATMRGPLVTPRIGIGIDDAEGVRIATLFSETSLQLPSVQRGESVRVKIETEPVRLAPGLLSIKLALAEGGRDIEVYEDALRLIVPDYSPFQRPAETKPRGVILVRQTVKMHESIHKIPA